jgi:hypothetical protein
MSSRLAAVLLAAIAVAVAACAGASSSDLTRGPMATAATAAPVSPSPTPVASEPALTPVPAPASPSATVSPDAGNVDDLPLGPVLSIESISAKSIRVDLDDLDAKAWRIVVAGTGALAEDRLELTVETGDVAPTISLVEIQAGKVVDRADLSAYGDPTATAGRCHASLGVCVDADAIVVPVNGDGHLGIELTRIADVSVTVTGETAGWPGEPFILGPWTSTEAFPWEPGVAF